MKIPTDRRASTDTSHYSPYPPITINTSPSSHAHAFVEPTVPSHRHDTLNAAVNAHSHAHAHAPENSNGGADSGGDAAQQYKVARAISSCTRCRQRKQKCDGKLPACSACERAKVECIGFDAISKTNVSRNYLHSLEQEIATLRAQVASLTSGSGSTDIGTGRTERTHAMNASQAIASFRSDIPIDPSLTGAGGLAGSEHHETMRSPWDSPARRNSDYFPSTPYSATPYSETPRSPFGGPPSSRAGSIGQSPLATSLTRLVHDAALRTGHAMNNHTTFNPTPSVTGSNSEKGSIAESPNGVVQSSTVNANGNGNGIGDASANAGSPDLHALSRAAIAQGSLATSPMTAAGSNSVGSKGKKSFAIPPLPPQPAVERLVAAYVDFVGVTAPIIHIPTLGKQLIKIREGNDVEQSDIFIVMMMLALSTMASSRFVDPPDELRACSEAFHAEAMKHLDAVFEEPSYVGLQAILLLVWYSLLNPDKGSIWFLVGLATRTCVDLGYHNEHNVQLDQLDALELDMRRRLFWVTYKMDRLLSQSLGRPPSIPDGFINVPLPATLHDVDIHPNHYGRLDGEVCSYKAVFIHTIKLRQLQSEILNNTYGVMNVELAPQEWFDECFERLKQWLAAAPDPRGTVSTEGYAISFHNSALLLYRPSPGNPRPGTKALATVLASSSYIIRIYRRMQLNNRISWLWMTSHFTFMAGLSFLHAFFNLYSAGGGQGVGVPTMEEAMMDIESCMAVLEYLAPRVPSAGACHDNIQAVSAAILDQIQKLDPPPRDATTSTTSPGRLRSAPISSSRNDPHPSEAFPAPLPAIPLPYELSLLDNLFVNPMMGNNKASDYTNGSKNRNPRTNESRYHQSQLHQASNGNGHSSNTNTSTPTSASAYGPPPQGFPPGAFQSGGTVTGTGGLNQFSSSHFIHQGLGHQDTSMGLGAYGIAAQVGTPTSGSAAAGGVGGGAAGSGGGGGVIDPSLVGVGGEDGIQPPFDLLSFLMDEGSSLAGGGWDNLDIPADFSTWT